MNYESRNVLVYFMPIKKVKKNFKQIESLKRALVYGVIFQLSKGLREIPLTSLSSEYGNICSKTLHSRICMGKATITTFREAISGF